MMILTLQYRSSSDTSLQSQVAACQAELSKGHFATKHWGLLGQICEKSKTYLFFNPVCTGNKMARLSPIVNKI